MLISARKFIRSVGAALLMLVIVVMSGDVTRGQATPVIVDVQSGFGNAASAALPTFAHNPATGDAIVVSCNTFASGTHLAPTDNKSNTYTQIGTQVSNSGAKPFMSLWIAKNITGGSSFVTTVHPNVTFYTCQAWVLRNVDPNPYNGDFRSAFNNGGAASFISTGATTVTPAPNSIFLAFGSPQQATAPTDPTGWNTTGSNGFDSTMLASSQQNNFASAESNFGTYKIASAVQTATWGTNTYTSWGAIIASFAPGAAAAATFPALFLAP